MSELQVGLLVIGAAIVAAVFGYNKWQESRYRREAQASLVPPGEDVLLRSGAPAARVEPTLAPRAEAVPAARTRAQAPGILSEAIDFIISIEAAGPVQGRDVIEAAVSTLAGAAKAVHMEGESDSRWEPLRREGSYRRLRIGMQLVDRRGAAGPEELRAFGEAAGRLAGAIGADVAEGDLDAALATARTLDSFSGEVDVQIAVHIVKAGETLSGAAVRDMAEEAGLTLDPDGRFRLRDGAGRELYSLVNGEAAPFDPASLATLRTSALLAELDVPRAAGGAAAFAPFRDFCLQAADVLGATLVDDNRTALGAPAFDAIATQLRPVYESMQAHGIAAGSPLALRLFS